MLTAIRIGNFKAFAESQKIPIRPDPDLWSKQFREIEHSA
jgi:hypothetical protein